MLALQTEPQNNITDAVVVRTAVYNELMSSSGSHANDHYLARIISSRIADQGMLPVNLGLGDESYIDLIQRHFSHVPLLQFHLQKTGIDEERIPEWEDLVDMLVEFRAGNDISEEWVAHIIAAACMGLDHLWQDLGLWTRKELSEVLLLNFPALASQNTQDMKWKKFLYKQLCARDGTYICRAPSCDVCVDYDKCFGPEE